MLLYFIKFRKLLPIFEALISNLVILIIQKLFCENWNKLLFKNLVNLRHSKVSPSSLEIELYFQKSNGWNVHESKTISFPPREIRIIKLRSYFSKVDRLLSCSMKGSPGSRHSTPRSVLVNNFRRFLSSKVSQRARLELRRRHRMSEHIAGNILAFGRGHFKSGRTSAPAIWSVRTVKSTAVNTFDRERFCLYLRGLRFVATAPCYRCYDDDCCKRLDGCAFCNSDDWRGGNVISKELMYIYTKLNCTRTNIDLIMIQCWFYISVVGETVNS